MTTLICPRDGYAVGDRLLEGVMFDVHLIEHENGDVTLNKVVLPDSPYTRGLNAEHWCAEVAKESERTLTYLREHAQSQNKTVVEILDDHVADGFDRNSILEEV